MNYISLNNLTRYHSKFKDYADAKYTLARDYGWKQTEKAGAVTCWPVGESRMKPVVEFLFKETLPEGTKGPSNPSAIAGVSSVKVTRCGKNLLPANSSPGISGQGVTFTLQEDGGYRVVGTPTTNVHCNIIPTYSFVIPANTSFKASLKSSTANNSIQFQAWTTVSGVFNVPAGSSISVAQSNERRYVFVRISVINGAGAIDTVVYPQIEVGDSETAFEPYTGTDYTLPLDNTYYGGTLDVASGKLTVTHRMIEADSLTLDISNYPAYLPLECTDTFGRTITSTGNILALTGSTGGKIVYKLANPYTVQIDPVAITSLPQIDKYTPRLNTLYTDAENITVKYIKSPIRDEYEKVQAIIANGGTI